MKILVCGRGFDTSKRHEVGIFELDQAIALQNAGHDVRFAALDMRSVRTRRPIGFYTYSLQNIPIYYCSWPLRFPNDKWNTRFLSAAGEYALEKICEDGWRPDIIHGHFGAGFVQAAKKREIPFAFTEHASHINRPDVPEKELREAKALYTAAARLLCVSRALRDNISRNTGISGEVVPNIVDVSNFRYAPLPHEGFRFVTAANLIGVKNIAAVIEAFSALPYPDAALTIFGDGELRGALEQLAREKGAAERIEFCGRAPREELGEFYRSADCFVLPSRSETFGVAYIEAMAAGLPVIATRCGGPEDFVTEENGVLVPVDDTPALREAMEKMYAARGRYDGARIARTAAERFSPAAVAAQLTRIYEECLSC